MIYFIRQYHSIKVEYIFNVKGVWDSMSLPEIRLHEGELNIMELLWSNKALAAKDISKIIKEYIGWEKNTTYTVIKRLIEKGAIKREDPGFLCKAAISKKTVQTIETKVLLNKLYNGSLSTFLSEYLKSQDLSKAEVMELQRIVAEQRF
jgi:predicted transcriptional regulator